MCAIREAIDAGDRSCDLYHRHTKYSTCASTLSTGTKRRKD